MELKRSLNKSARTAFALGAIGIFLFSVQCTKGSLSETLLPSELDTEASQVESPMQKGQADGATPLSVNVVLKRKDGTPVVRFYPQMSVLGEGKNSASCTTTDDEGRAICVVTSDTPGMKALFLKNAGLTRIASVTFESVNSTIASGVAQAPANGQTSTSVNVNLRDSRNNTLSGVVPQLQIDDASAVIKCQPANSQGVATCQIFSSQPGVKTVKVIDPPIQGTVKVEFKAPRIEVADARAHLGGGTPSSATSESAAVLNVVVKDSSGVIAPGVTPVLTITGPGSNQYSCTAANSSGVATCRITSDAAGDRAVSVTGPSGYAVADENVKVTFAVASNTVTPPAASVAADNSTEALVEVVLHDSSNHPLSGVIPHAVVEGSGTNSVRCEQSDSSGVAKCYVRSDSSGTKQVVIQDPPVADPAPVSFSSVPLVASVPIAPAIENAPAIVKVALPSGASAEGTIPVLSVEPSGAAVVCAPADSAGIASCFVKSEVSSLYTVKVKEPAGISQTLQVGFADPKSEATVVTEQAPSNGTSAAVIQIQLRTAAGIPRIGVTPVLAIEGSGETSYSCSASDMTGVATCTLTSTAYGDKTVKVTSPLLQDNFRVTFTDAGASVSAGDSSLTAIANGTGSSAKIVLHLEDATNHPRSGVTPELAVTGNGEIKYSCLPSDSSGNAECTITASESGTKTVRVLHPPLQGATNLTFNSNTRACAIANGQGSQSWTGPALADFGACTVGSCNTNYSISGNACAADSRSCKPMPTGASVCLETWNGTVWAAQTTTSCQTNYTLTGGVCVANTRACDTLPAHFTAGTQTWAGSAWGACAATACEYRYRVASGACAAADVTPDSVTVANVTGAALSSEITSDPVAITGIDVPIEVSLSGGTSSRMETKRGTGAWTDRGSSYNDVQSGDLLRVVTTSSSSIVTHTDVTVTLGDLAPLIWRVTTTAAVAPTGMALAHTAGTNQFALSWNNNGVGNGTCHPQYFKDETTWTNIAETLDCDAAETTHAVTLPASAGWTNNFNSTGVQVRIVRDSDSSVVSTLVQRLTCTAQTLPSSETTTIDEDCDGDWNNDADTSAPTGAGFSINAGDASTGLAGVTLSVTCPTDVTTPVEMAYGDTATPSNWVSCTSSVGHTLIAGTGSKTVYMRFRDGYGNTTAAISQSIFLDQSAPVGGDFLINGGETATADANVTLSVTCPTDDNGTVEYAFGNSANPSNWATCAASAPHSLVAGSGTKTVYVRFRDGHFNTTSDVTKSIVLDTTAPTAGISYTNGWQTSITVNVTTTENDAHTSIASCELEVAEAVLGSGSLGTFGAYAPVAGTGDGCGDSAFAGESGKAYKFRYKATDSVANAGSWNESVSVVKIDATPASGGSISYFNGLQASASIIVSVDAGTDAESGMSASNSDYLLEVASASYSGSSCGSFGSFADAGVSETASGTSYTFTGTGGNCYKFRYTAKNGAGTATTYTSSDIAMLDGTAPTGGSVSYTNGISTSTSLTVSVNAGSDGESGLSVADGDYLLEVAQGSLSANSCGSFGSFADAGVNETAGASSYAYTATSGTCYMFRYTVKNQTGLPATYTSASVVKVDTTAPSGGSVSAPASVASGSSVTVTVSAGSDAETGLSPSSSDYLLEVAQATLSGGVCGSYGAYADAGVSESSGATSYTYTGVTYNKCYKFRYTVKNQAALATTYTMAGETQRPQDTTPDAFSIPSQTMVASNTDISSGNLTLSGFDGSVSLGFSGNTSNAAFSTDGGSTWTAVSTGHTVSASSQFRVRQRSSSSSGASTTLTVTVGTGSSVNFVVTTAYAQTYGYSGGLQSFTVPAGVTSLQLKLWGAAGYSRAGCGGAGGFASGTLSVSPGETIYIMVGGAGSGGTGGYGGGGNSGGGGAGGGRTAIFKGGTDVSNEVITAGGGGGGNDSQGGYGGAGGGSWGQTDSTGACGGGGPSSAAGAGSRGQGSTSDLGAGGGGGYYGGAGGLGQECHGGGGSGYVGGVSSGVLTTGNYDVPANTADVDYNGSAGKAICGNYIQGNHGYVVIKW